jgi:hypothetical protein
MGREICGYRGIEIAAARAHHESFERRETHAGLDAPPASHGSRTRTVTQV